GDGGRDPHVFEPVLLGVVLFTETDHRDALRLEAAVRCVVVDDRKGRWLAGDLTFSNESRNLSAKSAIHGTGGPAGPSDALEQVDYEQRRRNLGDRRLLNAELHLVASSFSCAEASRR